VSDSGVHIDDFYSLMTQSGAYIFVPGRTTWPRDKVDGRLPAVPLLDKQGRPVLDKKGKPKIEAASRYLDRVRHVEAMSWDPGEPLVIKDRLPSKNGWVRRQGAGTLNLYLPPPPIVDGDPGKAGIWVEHIHTIYPEAAEHSIDWMAHRVQRPGEKINHALVWGGSQGIGKDSMMEPVRRAVGAYNFEEASPATLIGKFQHFTKAVILRINEGRDLGDTDRFKFYDHCKTYMVAPPYMLPTNEKFLREYYVANVMAVFVTTNHKTDGIYLPADDRRHYVAWSNSTKEDFSPDYWNRLWRFYEKEDGYAHVAAFLAARDISKFDPKAPPPQTPAFWDIVNVGTAPEDAELADLLDALKQPLATTLAKLRASATGGIGEWLEDRRHRRSMPHRMERCGYVTLRNPHSEDGLWKLSGKRRVVYVTADLTAEQRQSVIEQLKLGNWPLGAGATRRDH
jgi:hypothetical protein